jgi:anti-sigma factor RsiW
MHRWEAYGGCPDAATLTALLDGDADAETRAGLEEHVRRCGACAAEIEAARRARAALRAVASDLLAPADLQLRVRARLHRADRPARLRRWAIAGAIAAAVAVVALVSALQLTSGGAHAVSAATVARAHTDETLGRWPVTFASSNPVAVAAWVQAQTGRTIDVPDYSAAGYALSGVRREQRIDPNAVTLVYLGAAGRLTCTVVSGDPSLQGFAAVASTPGVRYAWTDGVGVAAWWSPDTLYLLAGDISADAAVRLASAVNPSY